MSPMFAQYWVSRKPNKCLPIKEVKIEEAKVKIHKWPVYSLYFCWKWLPSHHPVNQTKSKHLMIPIYISTLYFFYSYSWPPRSPAFLCWNLLYYEFLRIQYKIGTQALWSKLLFVSFYICCLRVRTHPPNNSYHMIFQESSPSIDLT